MEILRTQRLKFPRFVNLLSFEFVTGAFAYCATSRDQFHMKKF